MTISPVELQKHLKGADYPADGEQLAHVAEEHNAPEEVVYELKSMSGQRFDDPIDVSRALQQLFGDEDETASFDEPEDDVLRDYNAYGDDRLS